MLPLFLHRYRLFLIILMGMFVSMVLLAMLLSTVLFVVSLMMVTVVWPPVVVILRTVLAIENGNHRNNHWPPSGPFEE